MPGFSLAESLDPLNFDFRPFIDVSGVIPEPTSDQVSEFQRVLFTTIPIKGGKLDVEAFKAHIAAMPEGSTVEDDLYKAVADVCSGTPSVEQIKALPFRGQRAFVGYVMGTFLADPLSRLPGTNA